ncbi:tRNA (guanine(46)-N(7))-methyltransferase TrmB [Uliginosibacterium sediminicola]|uniref:tRNA (guanine(46)-N(7))-methyltransferase n=1 Tax=Uliginosibacterium sediminicola TaxID=2024550 RepID=A0ABU9YZI3_9RHOO
MYANSRDIDSAQDAPHEKLGELLARHRDHPFRKPISAHSQAAFDQVMPCWDGRAPILLDAGCGVGWSSLRLARAHPQHFVLGVDQSADRLARGKPGEMPDNLQFVRADLVDFWRLLLQAGIRLDKHFLLYPNPWPKIGQLARRWHGSPVFPSLLALGGTLECRSNWSIYVQELALAIGFITGSTPAVEVFATQDPLTPFERKYLDSGQTLYRLQTQL